MKVYLDCSSVQIAIAEVVLNVLANLKHLISYSFSAWAKTSEWMFLVWICWRRVSKGGTLVERVMELT